VGGWVQTWSTRHVGHLLAYCTCHGWLWGWRNWWNEWQGKPKYSEKTRPDATLSTRNPTWPDPGLNPGRRGGKPATNRFIYGAAFSQTLLELEQPHTTDICDSQCSEELLYSVVMLTSFTTKTVEALSDKLNSWPCMIRFKAHAGCVLSLMQSQLFRHPQGSMIWFRRYQEKVMSVVWHNRSEIHFHAFLTSITKRRASDTFFDC
jgi:hypothetical protein